MATKKKTIDRGKYLKKMAEEAGVNKTKLSEKAGYKARGSFYTHIKKPDLSMDILKNYARALNYDLHTDFPETLSKVEQQQEEYRPKPGTIEEALAESEYWKDLYIEVQRKYTVLLEKINSDKV